MSLPEEQIVPWHTVSSIRAGMGNVPIIRPKTAADLTEALQHYVHLGTRLIPLGNGTNLIGSDTDYPDLVGVKTTGLDKISLLDNDLFLLESGVFLPAFICTVARTGHGGMAALSGIPTTIGGALAMNAGANGSSISDFTVEINGIDLVSGAMWQWHTGEGGWGYRRSPVPPTVCITSAVLKLSPCTAAIERKAIETELERRRRVTPKGRSCGSVFRNPDSAPAGKLLEESGCKGMECGVFSVSQQHANWIVNLSGLPGKAEDCLALATRMKKMVNDKFGIQLQLEWRVC
ncbi:MAG: FAD-binding protein [Victivallales bacterium]|nr:FAD-binding protein [Victivallales bacterium]